MKHCARSRHAKGLSDQCSAGSLTGDRVQEDHLQQTTEADIIPSSELRTPLLGPKLRPPHPSSSLVIRERLLTLLDAGQERKLTLLSAPAGFGKTTLVSQWVQE